MSQVSFGADPEFTIFDPSGNPVPAHRFGIEDKHNPMSVYDLANKSLPGFKPTGSNQWGLLHRDGWNVEYNPQPTFCRESLVYQVVQGLAAIAKTLPAGYTVRPISAYKVDLRMLDGAPDDVQHFGCEPAMDAYSGYATIVPIDGTSHQYRYAGGHMHFASPQDPKMPQATPEQHQLLAKLMDQYVGLMLTCLFHGREQFDRRQWYGKAGEYRSQKYPKKVVVYEGAVGVEEEIFIDGFEYRTPPAEMWGNSYVISLAYGIARDVLVNWNEYRAAHDPARERDVANAINTGESCWELLMPNNFYTVDQLRAFAKSKSFTEYNVWGHAPGSYGPWQLGWQSFWSIGEGKK